MKLATEVSCPRPAVPIGLDEPVCLLGSCFADEMARKLSDAGFQVLANPFGTLYNPASLAAAVARLDDPVPFREEDCVPLGAGDGRIGSFSHHTSFARNTAAEFLDVANASLAEAAGAWKQCGTVILTLGTARVWRALERPGRPVVANCLKRPAREFAHELLSVEACARLLRGIVEAHPEKRFILTVSPIRHLGEGAHANTVSKSVLHLAVQEVLAGGRSLPDGADRNYFPDRFAGKPIPAPPSTTPSHTRTICSRGRPQIIFRAVARKTNLRSALHDAPAHPPAAPPGATSGERMQRPCEKFTGPLHPCDDPVT